MINLIINVMKQYW